MYKFCPHCGKTLIEGAGFCPHCGARIEQESTAAPSDGVHAVAPDREINSEQKGSAPKLPVGEVPQSPAPKTAGSENRPQSVPPAVTPVPAPADGRTNKPRQWIPVAAVAASVAVLVLAVVLVFGGKQTEKDTDAPVATVQPQDAEQAAEEQEKDAAPTPTPAPEETPGPTPEPVADAGETLETGDRLVDTHVLSYTNMPWYGAWKNVEDGSIMVWESYKVWANEGYTQQPDGSYIITLGDPRDTSVTFSEYYDLSPDYNHLEKYAPDGTLLAEYVTPAYADIKDALPETWWGYYTFVTGDYDRTQDTGYLVVDAFQVGGSPYGNAVAVDGGRYTIMQGDGMDSWQVTLACFENDGVQYLEFLDENGGSLGLYALEP